MTDLEWRYDFTELWLGAIRVGEMRWSSQWQYQWRTSGGDWDAKYPTPDAARKDLEAEVRRLLKEAGCEVEQ